MAAYTTINKSSLYFNNKIYTGNGSARSITGVGFQPDMVWAKCRNNGSWHNIVDVVRGVTKVIVPNETDAESTRANGLTAFGADGFSVGTDGNFNANNDSYASWNWKAGTGQGSANTDGSTNTTYTSVNTTAGFSISKYTGTGANATIGHGLGAAPKVVLIKRTSTTGNWVMGHGSLGFTKFIEFTTGALQTNSGRFNDTAPTSSVFSVGTTSEVNSSGATFIAYCFAEKRGYSSFGSYTGNNNADGPFVYTGFKPAFVLIKNTNDTANWTINDTARDPGNVNNLRLFPDTSGSENSGSNSMDMLSNGFKLRSTDGGNNGSNHVMIYMAFAENPLVDSTGKIPATAR